VSRLGPTAALRSPHPLGPLLPGLYHGDDTSDGEWREDANFAQRLTAAFDEVLAPALWCLDSVDVYLDPLLTPEDFLEWLAGWVGLELDENVSLERRRALVARAVALYRRRGTASALAEEIAVLTGVEPEIVESGGVAWSTEPGAELPGSAELRVVVRLPAEAATLDLRRLEAIVAAATPAHVVTKLEVEEQ
jgi:phage tail-like protein